MPLRSINRPGFFRYEGGIQWTTLPVPSGPGAKPGETGAKRVEALSVYNGHLYASSYDGGHVYRYDGETWTDCGQVGDNTQTYSFAQHEGELFVGTWPSGRVYRFAGLNEWIDAGQLGEEKEVMGMLFHNGRFLAGSLPLAQVYTYEGGTTWQLSTRLDHTPEVTYRRAWTMAEHDGQVFCSTLPSGKIFSYAAGRQVQWGRSLPGGWQHLAAVKSGDRLSLSVNGEEVAATEFPPGDPYDLSSGAPLRIGSGTTGPFNGSLREVRLYHGALDAAAIKALAAEKPGP